MAGDSGLQGRENRSPPGVPGPPGGQLQGCVTAPVPREVSSPQKQGCFVRLFHSPESMSHESLTPSDLISHLPQLRQFPRLPEGGRPRWEGVHSGRTASTWRQDTDI